MPTYKTTKSITESFLEKLFTSVGKGLRSAMVKQIVKKDPELGKQIKDLEKTRDEIDRRIAMLSPEEKRKALGK